MQSAGCRKQQYPRGKQCSCTSAAPLSNYSTNRPTDRPRCLPDEEVEDKTMRTIITIETIFLVQKAHYDITMIKLLKITPSHLVAHSSQAGHGGRAEQEEEELD